jgi:hypothetical protein
MKTLAAKTGKIDSEESIALFRCSSLELYKACFQVLTQSVNTRKSFIQLSEDYHTPFFRLSISC